MLLEERGVCESLVRRSPLLSERLQRNSLKFRVGKKTLDNWKMGV